MIKNSLIYYALLWISLVNLLVSESWILSIFTEIYLQNWTKSGYMVPMMVDLMTVACPPGFLLLESDNAGTDGGGGGGGESIDGSGFCNKSTCISVSKEI